MLVNQNRIAVGIYDHKTRWPVGFGICLGHGSNSTLFDDRLQVTNILKPGDTYRLNFRSKVENLRREGIQFNNCYVGVIVKNRNDKVVTVQVQHLDNGGWAEHSLMFRVPDGGVRGDVSIFLSKTGELSVSNVGLEHLLKGDSFQMLVDEMDQKYSFFDHKKVDWQKLTEKYRNRAENAETPKKFANVVAEMLAELKDIHTWAALPDGQRVAKFSSSHKPNYDFEHVAGQLKRVQKIDGAGVVGITPDGYGYVNVLTLTNADAMKRLMAATERMFDAPGIIVDLRRNNGGNENLGKEFASLFADKERVFAKSVFRDGAEHSDFCIPIPRTISPRDGKTYAKPVVCLVGPGCVSSGEAFAMMMKSLPNATVMGQPTRGTSGNPQVIQLPNGVDVGFSRWMSLLPDGTPIEGAGVPPDKKVTHRRGGDATFDKALKLLKKSKGK